MRRGAADLWTGFALMAVAGIYYWAALAIPDSLLSDAVGAGGLPKLLAVGLGISGALLAVRSQGASALAVRLNVPPRALGVVAGMAAYIAVLPVAGYPLALAVLVAGLALLGGAKPTLWLGVIAVAAGIGFWLVFARLLHIAMPAGLLARGM